MAKNKKSKSKKNTKSAYLAKRQRLAQTNAMATPPATRKKWFPTFIKKMAPKAFIGFLVSSALFLTGLVGHTAPDTSPDFSPQGENNAIELPAQPTQDIPLQIITPKPVKTAYKKVQAKLIKLKPLSKKTMVRVLPPTKTSELTKSDRVSLTFAAPGATTQAPVIKLNSVSKTKTMQPGKYTAEQQNAYQALRSFDATKSTTPVMVDEPRSPEKKPELDRWVASMRFSMDTHYKRTQNDAPGDEKHGSVDLYNFDVERDSVWKIGASTSIETSQEDGKGKQYDTMISSIDIGAYPLPGKDGFSFEGRLGDINGGTANIMSKAMDSVHAWEGLPPTVNKPPASSSKRILASTEISYLKYFNAEIRDTGWFTAAYGGPCVNIGTDRVAAGGRLGIQVGSTPNVSSKLPLMTKDGFAAFAEVKLDAVTHDIRTDMSGTETFQVKATTGIKAAISENLEVSFELEKDLTPTVVTSPHKRVDSATAIVTYRF